MTSPPCQALCVLPPSPVLAYAAPFRHAVWTWRKQVHRHVRALRAGHCAAPFLCGHSVIQLLPVLIRMPGALQVGCGADELIDLLMRCVLDPGDAIVDCPPTFTMYAFDADVNDARVITVPRLEGFKTDVEGIK